MARQEITEDVETEETTCTDCSGTAHEDEGYYIDDDLYCYSCFGEAIYFANAELGALPVVQVSAMLGNFDDDAAVTA